MNDHGKRSNYINRYRAANVSSTDADYCRDHVQIDVSVIRFLAISRGTYHRHREGSSEKAVTVLEC